MKLCRKGVGHHEIYYYWEEHRCNTRLKRSRRKQIRKVRKVLHSEYRDPCNLKRTKRHQKIEVTIPVKGGLVRSEQESSDMYVSIDLVEEVIERQLRKYKNKLVAREQEGGNFKQEFFEEDDKIEDAGEIKIVRTKKFGFKPMYPEDACVQMELLGMIFMYSVTQSLTK